MVLLLGTWRFAVVSIIWMAKKNECDWEFLNNRR